MIAKQYAPAGSYESKLKKVMSRLGIENAKAHGQTVRYGSDVFAQVVLSLEDLARMVERGIYDLGTLVAGMKYLPPAAEIPDCFRVLGYEQIPGGRDEITHRYRRLAKSAHPDAGGSKEQFQTLTAAYDRAMEYLEEELKNGN